MTIKPMWPPAGLHRIAQAIFWGALLLTFVCAELPANDAPQIVPWDKAGHFITFYVLAVLAAAAFPRRALLWVGVWLSAFGAFIEVAQAIPTLHRDSDFWDWVADTAAIAAALGPSALTRWRGWIGDSPAAPPRP